MDFPPVLTYDPIGYTFNPGGVTSPVPVYTADTDSPSVRLSRMGGSGPVTEPFEIKIAFTGPFDFVPPQGIFGTDGVTSFAASNLTVTNGAVTQFSCPVAAPTDPGFATAIAECRAIISPTGGDTVTISVPAGVSVDRAGLPNLASEPLVVQANMIAAGAPQLTATRANALTNQAQEVQFQFSKPITGFDVSDVAANAGTEILNFVASSSTEYSVFVVRSTDGMASLSVAEDAAQDAEGNGSNAVTVDFEVDVTRPTVSMALPSATAFPNTPLDVTVTFSENVTGFDLDDFDLAGGTAANLRGSDGGTNYIATITPDGSAELSIGIRGSAVMDAAGNNNEILLSVDLQIDDQAPTVTLTRQGTGNLPVAPFSVTVEFSEAVLGLELGDFDVTNSAASDLSCDNGDGNSPPSVKICTVTITPTAAGQLSVGLAAAKVEDRVGNSNTATQPLVVEIESPNPTVVISGPINIQTGPFEVTFTFDEAVTGFAAEDIAAANGTVSKFTGAEKTYTATITPTTDGALTVDVAADAAISAAGNGNLAAQSFSVEADITAPTIIITAPSETQGGPFIATFTFSETVTDFALEDIAVGNGVATDLKGSDKVYTATITADVDGETTIDVAAGSATDVAGNANTAAERVTIQTDATSPTLVIAVPTTTQGGPFAATFTFSEAVTGFALDDIVLGNGTAADLQGSDDVYTATITATADGETTIDVAAGSATDVAGNANVAANRVTVQSIPQNQL